MSDYVMNKDGKYGYLFCQDLSGLQATHSTPEAIEGGEPIIVRDPAHPREKLAGRK